MSILKFAVLGLICLAFLASTAAISEEASGASNPSEKHPRPARPAFSHLMDLAQLNLAVTDTETIEQISYSPSRYVETISLKADEGQKLVIVNLKGEVPEACFITIGAREFAALYCEKENGTCNIQSSAAISTSGDWLIPPEGGYLTSGFSISKPGPVYLKVAFILPEEITSFFVRYPTIAKGEARISEQFGEYEKSKWEVKIKQIRTLKKDSNIYTEICCSIENKTDSDGLFDLYVNHPNKGNDIILVTKAGLTIDPYGINFLGLGGATIKAKESLELASATKDGKELFSIAENAALTVSISPGGILNIPVLFDLPPDMSEATLRFKNFGKVEVELKSFESK